MESIAALGLASNIIQIVDFSSRLISHGRELYNSADGRTTEHTVLDDAIKALAELHSSLKITSGSRSYGSLTVADRHLIQLKAESERAVDELQQVLEKARLKNPGNNRKWQSIRQALSSVRTDKEISALAARLDKIRGQIDTAVLISIRYGTRAFREAPGADNLTAPPWKKHKPLSICLAFKLHRKSMQTSNVQNF